MGYLVLVRRLNQCLVETQEPVVVLEEQPEELCSQE